MDRQKDTFDSSQGPLSGGVGGGQNKCVLACPDCVSESLNKLVWNWT